MPKHLILVPTDLERRVVAARLDGFLPTDVRMELCGFGLVAAAARTATLVASLRPDHVTLLGIAGRFGDSLAVGQAVLFDAVACHGIGVGTGAGFISAASLGWPQWPGSPDDPGTAIRDTLTCAIAGDGDLPRSPLLVSVAAASAGPDDVALRRVMAPTAGAEDMEGFAVALACRLAGVPCRILRGISNDAGDREPARWRTKEALTAAAELLLRALEHAR
jgi:futalosine hydrolase